MITGADTPIPQARYRLERRGKRLILLREQPVIRNGRRRMLRVSEDVTGRFVLRAAVGQLARMHRALITDELTGLYNRRFIDRALSELVKNGTAGFTLLMLDIDRFKTINDTFGHVAGDCILRGFSRLLLCKIREGSDWVARYGGEEFLIFVADEDRKAALKTAYRIHSAVRAQRFRCGGTAVHLTCSIGAFRVGAGRRFRSAKELLELVDRKLYAAKENGRDRVEMS